MQTTERLKNELKFNQELMDLLDKMKAVAVSQFRALEGKREWFAKFTQRLEETFLLVNFEEVSHSFTRSKIDKLGIIMITSNEGFMGGLNSKVINIALAQPGADKAELILVGERGANYIKGMGRNFTAFHGPDSAEERYDTARKLKEHIVKEAKREKFGRLLLSFPKAVSFMVQTVEVIKLLPAKEIFEGAGSFPDSHPGERSGEGSHISNQPLKKEPMILESSLNEIIEYLAGMWIFQKVLEVLEESKLSEFAARAMHLERSYQELTRKESQIKTQYFRAYHAIIDKSMRESFSASLIRRRGER